MWGGDRLTACSLWSWNYQLINPETGTVGGRATIYVWNLLQTHNAKNQVIWKQWFGAFDVTNLAKGTTVSATTGCDGPCDPYSQPVAPRALPTDPGEEGWLFASFEFAGRLSGVPANTWKSGIQPYTDLAFGNPNTPALVEDQMWLDPEEWDIRCDYLSAGGDAPHYGCVFKEVWPVHVVVWAELPGHAEVITAAQNHRDAPGAPGDEPLTRLMDETLKKKKNGQEACEMWPSPRPPGEECDEYPFRSTWQGAYTGDPEHTFSDLIPESENQDGGEQLSWFYRYHRIIEKDPFYVEVET
ncbi:NucA/NucB deoxyribonuclease domain-containing protein [Thermoactinospora rubra]|uniref:NucA/NucB deoxyribonuclease domain-containing protein n=1 Tax=Thermoactinospora rubra TaxID=1088767 RepID=UPI001301D4E4|nr:hypothetical protein [Thermoactinospora rubra]